MQGMPVCNSPMTRLSRDRSSCPGQGAITYHRRFPSAPFHCVKRILHPARSPSEGADTLPSTHLIIANHNGAKVCSTRCKTKFQIY